MSSTLINESPGTNEADSNTRTRRDSVSVKVEKRLFFLTIPGMIRIVEVCLSMLHIGSYGYFCTYYGELSDQLTLAPFFLASTQEAFFMMVNFNTLLSTFSVIAASLISVRSRMALAGSLYVFVFDFLQFLLITSASVSLIVLYHGKEAYEVFGQSVYLKQGLAVTGLILGCLHLLGCIYDLGLYVRRTESES